MNLMLLFLAMLSSWLEEVMTDEYHYLPFLMTFIYQGGKNQ